MTARRPPSRSSASRRSGTRARVSLTLSETATVTVRVRLRKSGRVVRTARLQVRAGKRTLTRARRPAPARPLRRRARGARQRRQRRAGPARRPARRAGARMSALPNPFRPPADAWSRRDFMRNSFGAVALVCTLGGPGTLGGRKLQTSAGRRALAQSVFAPFQRDLPIMPEASPVATENGIRRLRPRHPRGRRRDPARHADADLRLRRDLPRPDDPCAQGRGGDRAGTQRARPSTATSTCTAATCRPRATAIRWT